MAKCWLSAAAARGLVSEKMNDPKLSATLEHSIIAGVSYVVSKELGISSGRPTSLVGICSKASVSSHETVFVYSTSPEVSFLVSSKQ